MDILDHVSCPIEDEVVLASRRRPHAARAREERNLYAIAQLHIGHRVGHVVQCLLVHPQLSRTDRTRDRENRESIVRLSEIYLERFLPPHCVSSQLFQSDA